VIAGNLPYIHHLARFWSALFAARDSWQRAVILVQAEVAARIVAQPGCREYGYLSVLVQTQARAERLIGGCPGRFPPSAKVDSAVVRLEPRPSGEAFGIE
jgi:16S rRNA (adenine1518-N6/adenine1519-N6)-dimethyltransferase